jgi:hypothetical protein
MKRSVSTLGVVGILTLVGCGGSDSGSSSSGGSEPASESGGSAIAACMSYHASHVDVVPSDPASACDCQIEYLTSQGHSSDELVTKLGDSVKQGTPLIMIAQANLNAACA